MKTITFSTLKLFGFVALCAMLSYCGMVVADVVRFGVFKVPPSRVYLAGYFISVIVVVCIWKLLAMRRRRKRQRQWNPGFNLQAAIQEYHKSRLAEEASDLTE